MSAGGLVRLAIRVRAAEADIALARLLPVLSAGAEERAAGEAVEYAVYGPPAELPSEAELRALAGDALLGVSAAPVRDGWETAWHAHLGRVQAGGFAIRPPWVPGEPGDLVIEPGTAFGAGGHPTTKLCLELLAELAALRRGERRALRESARAGAPDRRIATVSNPAAGESALLPSQPFAGALCDWGTGSGVLAIAAARLGFEPVSAVDVDPAAVELARRNAAANGVAIAVECRDLRAGAPWAPAVVANLPLTELRDIAFAPPERMIVSGLLAGQAFAPPGMVVRERRELDGWAALRLEAA